MNHRTSNSGLLKRLLSPENASDTVALTLFSLSHAFWDSTIGMDSKTISNSRLFSLISSPIGAYIYTKSHGYVSRKFHIDKESDINLKEIFDWVHASTYALGKLGVDVALNAPLYYYFGAPNGKTALMGAIGGAIITGVGGPAIDITMDTLRDCEGMPQNFDCSLLPKNMPTQAKRDLGFGLRATTVGGICGFWLTTHYQQLYDAYLGAMTMAHNLVSSVF